MSPQLHLWAPARHPRAAELERHLRAACKVLGVRLRLTRGASCGGVPDAGAWFEGAGTPTPALRSLVRDGGTLLPVLARDLSNFSTRTPALLHPINGHADDGTPASLEQMAQVLLQALGLVRRLRRVFISYARAESTGVAHQLAAELVTRGYAVFLDTWSVDEGTLFQEALWDAMAGSDVVLFCDTSKALESHWVRQELARRKAWDISMLHLVWPTSGEPRSRDLALSEAVYLDMTDFLAGPAPGTASARLRRSLVVAVIDGVEGLRLGAHALRRAGLEGALLHRARLSGRAHRIEPGRWIDLGPELRVLPVVGHPEPEHFLEAAGHRSKTRAVALLHDARGAGRERREILEHLGHYLPVQLVERSRAAGLVDNEPGGVMKVVFLSASVPDPRRDPRYHATGDAAAIKESVEALVRVVLGGGGRLVFGGHPAINPFVRQVAEDLGRSDRVRIYQSRWFWDRIPEDARAFTDLIWTPAEDSRAASLERMRKDMIASEDFDAAVFIGGMEGVERELQLFREQWPGRSLWPVGSTGGAARMILEHEALGLPAETQELLATARAYPVLFEELLTPSSRR